MTDAGATLPATKATDHSTESGARSKRCWKRFLTPIIALLLALALIWTITGGWNSWETGSSNQRTNDAFIRGDLTLPGAKSPE
jgi:multidrug resistance efflux pump